MREWRANMKGVMPTMPVKRRGDDDDNVRDRRRRESSRVGGSILYKLGLFFSHVQNPTRPRRQWELFLDTFYTDTYIEHSVLACVEATLKK
jgi:hypothetical protein